MDHVRRRNPRQWITLAGGLLFVQAAIALFVIPYAVTGALDGVSDIVQAVAVVVGVMAVAATPIVLGVAVQGRPTWRRAETGNREGRCSL